jgi:hypothetical protein
MRIIQSYGVMFVLTATAALSAQVRPMPPDPYDPHTATQPMAGAQGAEAPSYEGYQGPTDYPAAAVNAVPVAKAQATVARAVYNRARTALYGAVDSLREDFEYSQEFQSALREEKAAHDAYAAARDRALARLDADEDYQALKKLAANLTRKLEAMHQDRHASKDEILATASVKLDYTTRMSDRVGEILSKDSAVQSARTQLVKAGERVSDMRSQFGRSIRRDRSFVSARGAMDDARISYLGADAYLGEVIWARDLALSYAYWSHRYDPYNYYPWSSVASGYPYYSYGRPYYARPYSVLRY